jgi:hypothetical protein
MGTLRRRGRRADADVASSFGDGEMNSEMRRADGSICLLLVVVKTRDCSDMEEGMYDETLSHRSDRVDVAGRANATVEGSESPGKDERSTFTCDTGILELFGVPTRKYEI